MERTRPEFICQSTTLLAGAALLADAPSLLAVLPAAVNWPIGCFSRPWTKWTCDETLKASYAWTGLLTRTTTDPFIVADATPEYLDGLKRASAASGLTANVGVLRSPHACSRHNVHAWHHTVPYLSNRSPGKLGGRLPTRSSRQHQHFVARVRQTLRRPRRRSYPLIPGRRETP